jgi:hypothetical protein
MENFRHILHHAPDVTDQGHECGKWNGSWANVLERLQYAEVKPFRLLS